MKRYLRASLIALSSIMIVSLAIFCLAQRPHLLSVKTGSMGAAMPKGSLLIVGSASAARPKIGTIMSYRMARNPKILVSHRLVGYNQKTNQYLFKGDANPANDDWVSAKNIFGRVGLIIPNLGYVCDFIKTPVGLVSVVYFPASLVIAYEIYRATTLGKSYKLNK